MSRIGRVPIHIPVDISCQLEQDHILVVTGPKGSLKQIFPSDFSVQVEERSLQISLKHPEGAESQKLSMQHGTLCRLVINMIHGVSKGFEKTLELVGVGYKAEVQGGKTLKLSLGYSHDIFYPIPEGISIVLEKPTLFKIRGIDKQKVGQTVAEIVRFRPPEPYKGKGVREPGKFLRMKEGKTK